jgi:hypothetical protein
LAELFQALDGQFVGLGFHQPVGHDFYSWVVAIKRFSDFMTNRQSVDASICVSVHVAAKCRPSKLDAAARPDKKTAAVIVCDLP